MNKRTWLPAIVCFAALLAPGQPAVSQVATPDQMVGVTPQKGYSTLHLTTKLGSFKSLDGEGRFEINFSGTVLIAKLNGKVDVSGKIKKEFDKDSRAVYTGTGKITITGNWRGFQWFGHDMNGVWYGKGLIRISGEFDRELNTGSYWYDDPTKKFNWSATSVMTVTLPGYQGGLDTTVKPRERKKGGS